VKPANILLPEALDHAYLCDFGLAKQVSSDGMTQAGAFLGTVDYCAPEQIQGGAVDGRADLYSLGAVLFHCLAGEPPYRRESEFAVLEAHLHDAPPALSTARPGLPAALDGVLTTAMAKLPEGRYQSGRDLAEAFAHALTGPDGAVTRAAPPPAAPGPPAAGRRPVVIAGVVAGALLAVGATVGGLLATHGSSSSKERTFVDRIENVLAQSSDGRKEIVAALNAGFACRIPPREAGRRIGSVGDNRQSILLQLGSLRTPTQQADRAVTLLQGSLQQSIEADRHYRDAFFRVTKPGCPIRSNADFALARASDRRADVAKQRFLAVFNPLAERFGRRTWAAADI
jgi:hypothetical protein